MSPSEFLESYAVVINGYEYWPSDTNNKKLVTRIINEIGLPTELNFGNISEKHFHDKTGYFSDLDHNDNRLREKFLREHKKDIEEGIDDSCELFHILNVFY